MSRNAIHISSNFYVNSLKKGVFLLLQYANRVPPHIGLLIDDTYNSLNIKGRELNISGKAVIKNISIRRIPTAFIKIKQHPVFSCQHLNEAFMEQVKQFERVNAGGDTCLSPVKLFFEEFYAIDKRDIELVFDLLEALKRNDFIETAWGMHLGELKENIFYLSDYNRTDLQQQIEQESRK